MYVRKAIEVRVLLSTHADRHVGDISVTVCLFVCFCPQHFGNVVTDISGVG